MWTTPAKSDGKRRKRRTTMEVYDFEFEFRRDKAADAVAGRSLLPPVRIADCASCGWREHCNVQLEAGSGDPSLIPRVGYRQWRTLKDAGIINRAEVPSLDYPTAVRSEPRLRCSHTKYDDHEESGSWGPASKEGIKGDELPEPSTGRCSGA